MTGYALHPDALADINGLWDYIAQVIHGRRNPRVMAAILRGRADTR